MLPMKNHQLLIALAATACVIATTHAAPSAEQILDKWVDAVGGRAALEKIQSREAKGTIEMTALGLSADVIYLGKAPNKRLVEFTFAGFGRAREGYDGQTAWAANPGAPIVAKTGKELARAQREATFHPELNFTELYPKTAVSGSATVGDRRAWILKATTAEGDEEIHYFDKTTGRLIRKDLAVDSPEGRVKAEIVLEDFRKVDGINVAHTVRMLEPASVAFVMHFSTIRHNLPIPDSRFTQPTE
jgi:hypothetical protein